MGPFAHLVFGRDLLSFPSRPRVKSQLLFSRNLHLEGERETTRHAANREADGMSKGHCLGAGVSQEGSDPSPRSRENSVAKASAPSDWKGMVSGTDSYKLAA